MPTWKDDDDNETANNRGYHHDGTTSTSSTKVGYQSYSIPLQFHRIVVLLPLMAALMLLLLLLLLSAFLSLPSVQAFVVVPGASPLPPASHTATRLYFGIPSFLAPKNDKDDNDDNEASAEKGKIGWSGVVQLITAGMGAPFLGDYQGVDKETGKFMFSLEANNLVDENGNSKQTQMPYFENGWVDPEDEKRAAEGGGFKLPWQK